MLVVYCVVDHLQAFPDIISCDHLLNACVACRGRRTTCESLLWSLEDSIIADFLCIIMCIAFLAHMVSIVNLERKKARLYHIDCIYILKLLSN